MRTPSRDERLALCQRLDAKYRPRFSAFGGGFDSWANGALIAGEAAFGGSIGPICGAVVRYARRTGRHGIFGPLVPFKTLEEAELELCVELEAVLHKLASGWRPRMFRSSI